jgi:hypothetical protein
MGGGMRLIERNRTRRRTSMERARLVGAAFVTGLLITACAADGGTPPAATNDLLYMRTDAGVAMVQPGSPVPEFHSVLAEPDPLWETVVRAERVDGFTRVTASVPTTGEELWSRDVPGRMRIKVVSPQARFVALAPGTGRYLSTPRKSRVVVTGRDVATPISIDLDGNFEPEAFSTDGTNLFVVQYRPAPNPQTYQVRRLELATGRIQDVFSVDKELQEEMRGTARVQEMSPDGTRLYTLYTLDTVHGPHSFVHVLALDEMWAHCIDLPHDFLLDKDARTALGVSPDGKSVYVADTKDGQVASLDARTVAVRDSGRMDLADELAGADLTVSADGRRFFIASGSRLVAASTDFEVLDSWELDGKIRGVQLGADPRTLYVALRDEVVIIDLETGEQLKTWDPPGVSSIHGLGPATKGLDAARTKIVCGC